MRKATGTAATCTFATVREVGLALPGVEAAAKYDGSPVLKVGGSFMAGLATHSSAEPESLVVRATFEDRAWLLEDAPGWMRRAYLRYGPGFARLVARQRWLQGALRALMDRAIAAKFSAAS